MKKKIGLKAAAAAVLLTAHILPIPMQKIGCKLMHTSMSDMGYFLYNAAYDLRIVYRVADAVIVAGIIFYLLNKHMSPETKKKISFLFKLGTAVMNPLTALYWLWFMNATFDTYVFNLEGVGALCLGIGLAVITVAADIVWLVHSCAKRHRSRCEK